MGTYHDDTDLVTKVAEIIQNLTEKSRDAGMSSKLDFERKGEQRRTISPEHRGSMNTATDGKQASFFLSETKGKKQARQGMGQHSAGKRGWRTLLAKDGRNNGQLENGRRQEERPLLAKDGRNNGHL